MSPDGREPGTPEEADPERVGVIWIGTEQAVIAQWDGEPVVEHIESGVTPRRRAVGSVRRGPARPQGGGRVMGHGTKTKHDDELRRFLSDISARVDGLTVVEVAGRGAIPERFADLLRRDAEQRNEHLDVTSRALSRRPSDAQLIARLRRLADRELPRKRVGRYRLPPVGPTTKTGKPLRPGGGRRTLRPARAPEWKEIDEELEAILSES